MEATGGLDDARLWRCTQLLLSGLGIRLNAASEDINKNADGWGQVICTWILITRTCTVTRRLVSDKANKPDTENANDYDGYYW